MKNINEKKTTHFGFKNILKNKKTKMIENIFHIVASKYDVMNDLMSFGIHRMWKQYLIYHSDVYHGCKVLDLAGGTGDLSIKFSQLVGDSGLVVLADINRTMLEIGQKKIRNLGILKNVLYVQTEAESLPFPNNTFDCVAISFGLRNFTHQKKALFSTYNVLKPGGKLLILDFSMPKSKFVNLIYNFYSFHILPKIGNIIVKDTNSYRYLVESIRMHIDPESLKEMMSNIGFRKIEYFHMTYGIAVLHCAQKI